MSTVNDTDLLLVERNGVQYQITYDQMSTLNDDDLLLVERGGVQYKVEAQHVSTGANGLIIPPVEVLTPVNGAGITEFDSYEPVSSAITAVGEAGTIPKDTDEIQSVVEVSSSNKILSFPTNTNFSRLSVGDVVQGGTIESPVMIATSTLGGTDFVVENFETVDTTSTSVQTPSTFDHASRVRHLCFYLSDATSDVQVNMGGSGWVTYSSVDGVNWVQGTTHGGGSALVRTLSSNNPSAKYFLLGGLTSGYLYSTWSTFEFQSSFVSNWNPPYTLEMPVGGSITPGVEITAIDASGPSQTDVYATFDPDSFNANQGTMSNGNLTLNASGSYYIEGKSTLDVFSGDNYSELTVTSASGSDSFAYGIGDADTWIIAGVGSYFIYRENGSIVSYPGNTTVDTVASYTQGDVLGMAVDSTNVKFYKNGYLQGTYAHGKSGTFYVYAMNVPNTGSAQLDINFGATAFTHTAPSGYSGLSEVVTTYPTVTVDGGTWTTSDRLTSQISYETSLTFTDDTQLANMVGPLEMTDANGNSLTPSASIASILEISGNTILGNGVTGTWVAGNYAEGSSITDSAPSPDEVVFTSQNDSTPAFTGADATLASRTWTLESGTTATGPWTLIDSYSDFEVLSTQTGATPWSQNKPTLQANTYYRIKVAYNSTNAESVESVYNTFKTGDA